MYGCAHNAGRIIADGSCCARVLPAQDVAFDWTIEWVDVLVAPWQCDVSVGRDVIIIIHPNLDVGSRVLGSRGRTAL